MPNLSRNDESLSKGLTINMRTKNQRYQSVGFYNAMSKQLAVGK